MKDVLLLTNFILVYVYYDKFCDWRDNFFIYSFILLTD